LVVKLDSNTKASEIYDTTGMTSRSRPAVGSYYQSKAGVGITASYGFGLAGKANIVGFSYKRSENGSK